MKRQTTNRRRDATVSGYTLPLVIDPPRTLCVCVPVPDDQFHRAAFLGQMLALSRWYTWERDDDHQGKEAAAVWEQIWVQVRDQMTLQPRNCGCGCGDNRQERLNADGSISISTDGGLSWTPATPAQDPRQSGSYLPPVTTESSSEKCAAANSAVAYFKQKQAEAYAQMTAGATAAELATLFIAFLVAVGVIATGGALAVFGAGIGALLASFDAAGWNALFTDDLWDDLLCKLVCAMDDTGSVTQTEALSIATSIYADHPNRAGQFVKDLLTGMGTVGLTNAIRMGLDGSLSCDDCDCPLTCGDPAGITYGNVIESGLDELGRSYLIVESVVFPGDTFNLVAWGEYGATVPPNICCHLTDETAVVGTWISSEWTDCAGSIHASPGPAGHDLGHAVYYNNASPFTIRLTFEGCYSC